MNKPVLSVRDLSISIRQDDRISRVVDRVSFDVYAGEVLALVGESGCGKTKTAEAILGILPSRVAALEAERIELDGTDLARLTEARTSDPSRTSTLEPASTWL